MLLYCIKLSLEPVITIKVLCYQTMWLKVVKERTSLAEMVCKKLLKLINWDVVNCVRLRMFSIHEGGKCAMGIWVVFLTCLMKWDTIGVQIATASSMDLFRWHYFGPLYALVHRNYVGDYEKLFLICRCYMPKFTIAPY